MHHKISLNSQQERTMIIGDIKPLDIAKRVLSPNTISSVQREPFHLRSWKILERWAFNSPEKLKQLERGGKIILLGHLLEQQNLEHGILLEATEMLNTGVSEHEILTLHEVQTELI
ncbi:hypothetical protein [Candidatus Glomeribacter gigasporarum]|uniref:hypothetical protein n=1 Tax=Candidatus Glomeribacter gigasporarum TaxID=132144 RepID=UPI0003010A53|nr:hypothetical protein [Candidatus Glomeribacter gigasporarum]